MFVHVLSIKGDTKGVFTKIDNALEQIAKTVNREVMDRRLTVADGLLCVVDPTLSDKMIRIEDANTVIFRVNTFKRTWEDYRIEKMFLDPVF